MISSSEASAIELHNVSCLRAVVERQTRDSIGGVSILFKRRSFSVITSASAGERDLLFRILNLSESPDAGDVLVEGVSTRNLNAEERADLRARRIGMMFSAPFLLPALSVIENIAMPMFKLEQVEPAEARSRAEAALAFVGLAGSEQTRSEDLSRAQQHGVSLARALAANPAVLLVEEIDSTMTSDVFSEYMHLLLRAVAEFELAIIATASTVAGMPDSSLRFLCLENGVIRSDSTPCGETFS
jgi:ABC-type methionine transport system ATPase subunit